MIYILDCGHSKETKGKRSPDGRLREYEYNRIIGRMVGDELSKLGIQYHFTYNLDREDDLPLSKRAEAANAWARGVGARNCLLISIHSNASGNGGWMNAKGWSVYTTEGTTNSDRYATIFWEEARKVCGRLGRKTRQDMSDGDPDWEKNFTVIYKTICPSILIEEFFYDNKEEMEWMLSDEGKSACVEIIINAIKRIEGIC